MMDSCINLDFDFYYVSMILLVRRLIYAVKISLKLQSILHRIVISSYFLM
jgi:hypothetical protein